MGRIYLDRKASAARSAGQTDRSNAQVYPMRLLNGLILDPFREKNFPSEAKRRIEVAQYNSGDIGIT